MKTFKRTLYDPNFKKKKKKIDPDHIFILEFSKIVFHPKNGLVAGAPLKNHINMRHPVFLKIPRL